MEESPSEFPILEMSEIRELGTKHNEALGKVLFDLEQNKVSQFQDASKIQNVINSSLNSYYQSAFDEKINHESATDYSSTELSKHLQFNSDAQSMKSSNSEGLNPIEKIINENEDHLTTGQIEYLTKLNDVLLQSASNVDGAIDELEDIQNSVQHDLSDEEAQVILIGAEVGKASLAYWDENLDNWQEVLNNTSEGDQLRAKGWFNWSELSGSDVAGAVAGAVGAAAVNVIPGAGQVGYGGAVVGGAAAGSVGNAVSQIWNELF